MQGLISIDNQAAIPEKYHGTAIEKLLQYHNLEKPYETYNKAELLVGMCMDHRKHLLIPDNFAYIIRAGGANLRHSEFKVSFAVAIGGVKAIALIGHSQCGMVNVAAKKDQFIDGLVSNAGWDQTTANEHFMQFAPLHEIGNAQSFILSETERLRKRYPKVLIAPMYYLVEDNRLYLLDESEQ